MAKDLIIGAASNYTWDQLKHWVNSIRRSGFEGDVVLVATNIKRETLEKLAENNIDLFLYGKKNENGDYEAHNNGAPHVERFFYIWNYLNSVKETYRFVITTDTRDVVFQSDPSKWIDDFIMTNVASMITSSEGIKYKDEPWNDRNMLETFGPYFHNSLRENLVYNVGVLAGEHDMIRDLMLMIFQMSINRPIPIVDQAVFNFLIHHEPYKSFTAMVDNSSAWAAQLGVTLDAVQSGSGDIGLNFGTDPSKQLLYQMMYQDKQPSLNDDGLVVNDEGKPFVIVHQYDRTHSWRDKITARYE